jgi:N-acylneuraminate cytidylyltransferase
MKRGAVAIITARGGSKRIPRKNVRSFLGRPILAYSVEAALASGLFDEVMVSSDDQEILELARALGASTPFTRSPDNSNDTATTADVLLEVLEEYRRRGDEFEHLCCIYPTAPFVSAEKLRQAHELLRGSGADAVIPVVPFSFPIWRSFKLDGGRLAFNWPENALRRSQDLPPAYHDCGQFYFLRTEPFLAHKRLVMDRTVPIIVSEREAQDIDTEEDWKIAEIKYSLLAQRRS